MLAEKVKFGVIDEVEDVFDDRLGVVEADDVVDSGREADEEDDDDDADEEGDESAEDKVAVRGGISVEDDDDRAACIIDVVTSLLMIRGSLKGVACGLRALENFLTGLSVIIEAC